MTISIELSDSDSTGAISALYQRAAAELLLAYQRNKEATRHHQRGAFRAALHHARLSCKHSWTAHEHLASALELNMRLSAIDAQVVRELPAVDRCDH